MGIRGTRVVWGAEIDHVTPEIRKASRSVGAAENPGLVADNFLAPTGPTAKRGDDDADDDNDGGGGDGGDGPDSSAWWPTKCAQQQP
jgi:hypothetical protein